MSAQLTSSLSRRKTPNVPWYVPLASTTSSPAQNVGPPNRGLIMFVYLFCSAFLHGSGVTVETSACSQLFSLCLHSASASDRMLWEARFCVAAVPQPQ